MAKKSIAKKAAVKKVDPNAGCGHDLSGEQLEAKLEKEGKA